MWQVLALFICGLVPSLCCLLAAWWSGTPESVIAGTIIGGFIAVIAAIGLLA